MRAYSPLRYPGGKAALAGLLAQVIEANGLRGCPYFEPFAGGAGAALQLLLDGVVSELRLNDLDPRIYAFWRAALDEHERFVDMIMSVELTLEQWRKQKDICLQPNQHSTFDLGFAAFYLNRCNRSGILLGSAPIGGYSQTGTWRIDARFYRQTLADRITKLAKQRERIHIANDDARRFLARNLPTGNRREQVFVYLDPPYVSNGNRLYMNNYQAKNHSKLAHHLRRQRVVNWVVSYDDTLLIRRLYGDCKVSDIPLRYSLQQKRKTNELLITPRHLQTPPDLVPATCTFPSPSLQAVNAP